MAVAVDRIETWIYVTGVPRCGSTFVGKVLSLPRSVDYLHEPFNPGCGIAGLPRGRFHYVRGALDTETMRALADAARRLLRYDVRFKGRVPPDDPWRRRLVKRALGSRGPFYLRLAKLNPFHRAAVIKDPTAPLLAAYLHDRFGVVPVVVVRHPVSLVASLQRVGWAADLKPVHAQPALIEDFFSGPEEQAFLARPLDGDPVVSAAAHWRAMYHVLLRQADAAEAAGRPWVVLTHEAVSAEPVPVFRGLYERLGLPWSERVEGRIRLLTEGGRAEVRRGRVQDLRRDSASIFEHRRDQLSLDERRRIFDVTADVALRFYDRASFALDDGPPSDGTAAPASPHATPRPAAA